MTSTSSRGVRTRTIAAFAAAAALLLGPIAPVVHAKSSTDTKTTTTTTTSKDTKTGGAGRKIG